MLSAKDQENRKLSKATNLDDALAVTVTVNRATKLSCVAVQSYTELLNIPVTVCVIGLGQFPLSVVAAIGFAKLLFGFIAEPGTLIDDRTLLTDGNSPFEIPGIMGFVGK